METVEALVLMQLASLMKICPHSKQCDCNRWRLVFNVIIGAALLSTWVDSMWTCRMQPGTLMLRTWMLVLMWHSVIGCIVAHKWKKRTAGTHTVPVWRRKSLMIQPGASVEWWRKKNNTQVRTCKWQASSSNRMCKTHTLPHRRSCVKRLIVQNRVVGFETSVMLFTTWVHRNVVRMKLFFSAVLLQDAFWGLVQICEKYLPGYYSPGLVRRLSHHDITPCQCNNCKPGSAAFHVDDSPTGMCCSVHTCVRGSDLDLKPTGCGESCCSITLQAEVVVLSQQHGLVKSCIILFPAGLNLLVCLFVFQFISNTNALHSVL